MVAIIDYDAGNIKSVEKAVHYLGKKAVVTSDPNEILSADRVILPGVGAFGDAMKRLHDLGLVDVIRRAVQQETPFLGICLGLQLLFEKSEESPGVAGLGLLRGEILRLPDIPGLKVPHIGWNSLKYPNLKAQDEGIVTATTEYGTLVHASIESGNLFACQFHPEKSSETGLTILENFLSI